MVRMRCGMGVSDALTLWKWRELLVVVEWTLLLENRMDSLFRVCVACLIVTSYDVDSIDESVCEMKWSADSVVYSYSPPITWVWERNHANLLSLDFLIPIHSTSLLYHLHRLALESRNCNHHHSFSFLINTKQSLSNPSPQTHQLNSFQFIIVIPLQSNSPPLPTRNLYPPAFISLQSHSLFIVFRIPLPNSNQLSIISESVHLDEWHTILNYLHSITNPASCPIQ